MDNIFYILSIVFIFMNIYYLFKKRQLDRKFKESDISGVSKLDLVYYGVKILSWVWIPIGFFTNQPELFYVLFVLGILKYPIYHLNKNIFRIYNDLYPVFCISTLITIFVYLYIGYS